jgi:hypothetical protein
VVVGPCGRGQQHRVRWVVQRQELGAHLRRSFVYSTFLHTSSFQSLH